MPACPACGKKCPPVAAPCGRCGCDLTRLVDITDAAQRHLADGLLALRRENPEDALTHAETSWALVHSREAVSLAALSAVALRDPAALSLWQLRLR